MRIRFTNEKMTVAEVERGWFRKVYVEVNQMVYQTAWCFTSTGMKVPAWLDVKLDRAQERGHWQPVVNLPQARTVQ